MIKSYVLFLAVFFSVHCYETRAGIENCEDYLYFSPQPNTTLVSRSTQIMVRFAHRIPLTMMSGQRLIEVRGSRRGVYDGEIKLLHDERTLVFIPQNPFQPGEQVYVHLKEWRTESRHHIPGGQYQFTISPKMDSDASILDQMRLRCLRSPSNATKSRVPGYTLHSKESAVRENQVEYPEITVDLINNPSGGYLFLSPMPASPPFAPGHLMIIDNYGIPIFYRKMPEGCIDFKRQPNGLLTYYDLSKNKYYALDSAYTVIDSFFCGNGYTTDFHELQLLPDGHALMMSYDPQIVDMSTIVPGGKKDATVVGNIIQEIDTQKTVVFQWRTWDHIQITDATSDIDLASDRVDYAHANAIEFDHDGHLMVSFRHLDEIIKINRQTGEIIWRLGGINSKKNQFDFINDSRTFSHQHDIRRLSNGNITMFDNGNLLEPQFSSVLEYQLDEKGRQAQLVWSYRGDNFGFAIGNAQRLSNGHTVVGWGPGPPTVREVDGSGTETLELIADTLVSYRVFRFPWRTNRIILNKDTVIFSGIDAGDSSSKKVVIYNNRAEKITITDFEIGLPFEVEQADFPIVLSGRDSLTLVLTFRPEAAGVYTDTLHIRSDQHEQRIAQTVFLSGTTFPSAIVRNKKDLLNDYRLFQNYPNPFNPITHISYHLPVRSFVSLRIYNLLGQEVATLVKGEKAAGFHTVNFDASKVASGIYIYRMEAEEFTDMRKLLFLK